MDSCDWPWWIMFAAAMVSSYFREMLLRRDSVPFLLAGKGLRSLEVELHMRRSSRIC